MGAVVIIFCKILNSKFLKGLRHSAVEKSQTNATNMSMHPLVQAI